MVIAIAGRITFLGRAMVHIGDAKSRTAGGPKMPELKGEIQSSMELLRLIARIAGKEWFLDRGNSVISMDAQIIQNALGGLILRDPARQIHQISGAGGTRPDDVVPS